MKTYVQLRTTSESQAYSAACDRAGIRIGDEYGVNPRILTRAESQGKLAKSDKMSDQFMSAILHLAPHELSGFNVCPMASFHDRRKSSCAAVCVAFNGHGMIPNASLASLETLIAECLTRPVHLARIARTRLAKLDFSQFRDVLIDDIARFQRSAEKQGKRAAIRLNGTSDLPVSSWQIIERFPDVQFYDYSKVRSRVVANARGKHAANYHLTYSVDEHSTKCDIESVLNQGGNVAMVIRSEPMKTSAGGHLAKLGHRAIRTAVRDGIPGFRRYGVVSGDKHDMTFLHPRGAIIALYAKGRAARDSSGFVRDLEPVSAFSD